MRLPTTFWLAALGLGLMGCSGLLLPPEPANGPDIMLTLEPAAGSVVGDNGFEVQEFPSSAFDTPDLSSGGFEVGEVPSGLYADVLSVIDGDTITVRVDNQSVTVRYIGVDTPEREEPFYAEAKAANESLVGDQTVILVQDVSDVDEYGRWLRYVYREDGVFVNAELIRQGFGRIVSFPPDVAEQANFLSLQEEAQNAGRGLWGVAAQRGAPAGCVTCAKNAYDCRDFPSQAAAQACYNYCLQETGRDIHRLSSGDPKVCKSLP